MRDTLDHLRPGSRRRIVLAIIVAPTAPVLVFTMALLLGFDVSGAQYLIFYAVLLGWTFGYPAFRIFEALSWRRLWQYVGASLASVLLAVAWLSLMSSPQDTDDYLTLATLALWLGVSASLQAGLFWVVAFVGLKTDHSPASSN